jgi:hypothetical protein|tara:strand:+ start:155 stop:760 length:606 start_codon:yes stop_codon:yes gene_type:complete
MLEDLKDKYEGRIFVLGTGESLIQQLPVLKRLESETTFCTNMIDRWKELPFTPTFYMCQRKFIKIGEHPSNPPYTDCRFIMLYDGDEAWEDKGWVSIYKSRPHPLGLLVTGKAVGMAAEIASYIGFSPIYLLGFDLIPDSRYCFDTDLVPTFYTADMPFEKLYSLKNKLNDEGTEIYDCTPGGGLSREKILEYRSLEEVLA